MSATSAQMQYMEQRKTPAVAILLSFIISGAGQIYNGEVGKGIGMIIAYIFCFAASALILPVFILIALWIWGMIDANTKAKEFNDALKQRLDNEDATSRETAEQQLRIKATTITSQEFVTQVDKYFKLFQSSLLSDTEFEAKKNEFIINLNTKKLVEAPEDFLTAVIPLIQKKALTEKEIAQIKAAVI
jgi:TM2 domain-containing membrane protein YozV